MKNNAGVWVFGILIGILVLIFAANWGQMTALKKENLKLQNEKLRLEIQTLTNQRDGE